jgi:hypothetical protein
MMSGVKCLAVLFVIALSGCQTDADHVPPITPPAMTSATLMGSRTVNASPFRTDLRAYVGRIDGKLGGGPNAWSQPVRIAAGEHDITIGVVGGENMFSSGSRYGFVQAKASLKSGTTYYLRTVIQQESALHDAQALAWIEDEDGLAVTEKLELGITPIRPVSAAPVIFPAR